MIHLILRSTLVMLIAGLSLLSRPAQACGCFAGPPAATTPVIQAGERILFAVQNGKVTAHIQIQYSGDAKDFGWLLPLPSVPVIKAGTDELFTQLAATTDPLFRLNTRVTGQCPQPLTLGCGASLARSAGASTEFSNQPTSALVFEASVGPYDAAVLKADDKNEMITWLADNRFVVPTTSDAALGPYLRPGAFFLALKLKSGKTAGDLTPVVVEYASELPMIPITLTSIGATPNMGVQVFVVGNGRAIPRNYRLVELNEVLLDWETGGQNYQALVTRAVGEAPGKHAFVTDYAGPSSVMKDVLVPAGRFGTEADLATNSTPTLFVAALWAAGFGLLPPADQTSGLVPRRRFPPALQAVLLRTLPVPASLAQNVTPDDWFDQFETSFPNARQQSPADFTNYPVFSAPQLAREVFAEYVAAVKQANQLFTTFPTLTRLFTTLSPADMTRDPVFSFNVSLPEVPRVRTATQEFNCSTSASRIITSSGASRPLVQRPRGPVPVLPDGPGAARIASVGEEGPLVVETDNAAAIAAQFPTPLPQGGCSVVADPMMVGLLVLVARLHRRR